MSSNDGASNPDGGTMSCRTRVEPNARRWIVARVRYWEGTRVVLSVMGGRAREAGWVDMVRSWSLLVDRRSRRQRAWVCRCESRLDAQGLTWRS